MDITGISEETRELYEIIFSTNKEKTSVESEGSEDESEELNEENDQEQDKIKNISKRPMKRRRGQQSNSVREKSEKERNLEKVLFGDKETLLKNLEVAAKASSDDSNKETSKKAKERKPAWHDSDDEQYIVGNVIKDRTRKGIVSRINKERTYDDHLQKRFKRIQSEPKWADLDREREVDSDEELLQSIGHLDSQKTSSQLSSGTIQYKKLKDVNRAAYAESGITSLQFHPTSTVALVAGLSGVASLYSIDGLKNEKLHSMLFQKYQIKCARILPCGTEIIFGGNKNYFYSFDLMQAQETRIFLPKIITKLHKFEVSPCGKYLAVCGRFGEVHIMDTKSKELLYTLKQEYLCTALHFSNDSTKLLSHSENSEVNIFDLRQNKIEHVFTDDGCIKGKTLAVSPNSNMLATGSNEGVVNVYNYNDVLKEKYPKPQKIIYNLRTSISCTKFNHSSELLGMCSTEAPEAIKLVHFPSGTVFSNFPGQNPGMGHIRIVEFSPGSGFLAIGNSRKEVPLYRLQHYKNY